MSNFSRRRSDRAFIDVFQNTHPKRADTLSVSDADSRVFDLAHSLAEIKVEVAQLQPGNHLVFHTDPSTDPGVTVKQTPQSCLTLVKLSRPESWRLSPYLHRQLIAQIQRHLDLHE